MLPRRTGDGECRALPEIVMVDLGHGRPEPFVELRLRRLHVLPLSLEGA